LESILHYASYWIETGIVGLLNIFKIIRANGPTPEGYSFTMNGRPVSSSNKAFIVAFFIFHYGLFWTVHGVFVVVIFGFLGGSFPGLGPRPTHHRTCSADSAVLSPRE
jgi:hypothetical protein